MISLHRLRSFPLEDPVPRNAGTVSADRETASRRLVGHLRYLRARSRSRGEASEALGLFSATSNQVDRQIAVQAIIGTGGDPVVWHKLILTPHQRIGDYRTWTRQQMNALPLPAGHRRCWFGIVHQQPTVHIHVVLAGERTPAEPLARAARLLHLPPRAGKGEH
jgi:hypothetical protein